MLDRSALTFVTAMLIGGHAIAAAPERTHTITLDDYFTVSIMTEIEIASDHSIAYVEQRWDEQLDRRNADIWVLEAGDSGDAFPRARRLTFDDANDTHPRWSVDNQWIYFTSARSRGDDEAAPYNGASQIWRIPAAGGEPVAITRLDDGVHAWQLSDDGDAIYYTTGRDDVEDDPWADLRSTHADLEYGHGVVTYSQLWKLDLNTWRTEKLVDVGRVIDAFSVSPDEQRIAMITVPDNTLLSNEGESTIDVYDARTRRIETLDDTLTRQRAPSPHGWFVELCWTSDSTGLAFRVDFDGYPGEVIVATFGADGTPPSMCQMIRPNEVSIEGHMEFVPGTHDLTFIADDHARARLMGVRDIGRGVHGDPFTVTAGDVVVNGFDWSDGTTYAAIMSGLDHGTEAFGGHRSGTKPRRLTSINPQMATWKLPQISVVKWTSADGTPVEGILELPPDYTPADGPLPLLVEIHGGPTASSKLQLRYWIYGRTYFAANGWALLSPNYRGSTGYGDTFLIDLIGNKNNLDVQDILAGVDAMIERGIADPDRMAITGWSNGGYLVNCLITTTDRFRAASSGAGVFDTVMQWSIEDTPGHVINYAEGLPWTNPQGMHRSSPLYKAGAIRTPTLIHVGENDPRVPAEHSRALHRSLHHYVGTPVELVIYPGAGHGLTKASHRRAKMAWEIAWFEHFVIETSSDGE